jgi:hypothetical protein
MHIGKELRAIKLKKLIKSEGYENLEDLLEDVVGGSVSPAIAPQPMRRTLDKRLGR